MKRCFLIVASLFLTAICADRQIEAKVYPSSDRDINGDSTISIVWDLKTGDLVVECPPGGGYKCPIIEVKRT